MPPSVEVVAHRGASAYAAEHTFEAYDLALALAADALELDVRLTADARPVVLHDATLERTTGDPRRIADVRARELDGPGRPPLLDDVLARYRSATGWLIELKDPDPALEEAVVRSLRAHGLAGLSTIQSFDHRALRRLRLRHPDVSVAPLLCESSTPAQVLDALRRTRRYASALGAYHRGIDVAVAHAARRARLPLRAYTVNDPHDMRRLIGLGIDGLITDAPDRARHAADAVLLPAAA